MANQPHINKRVLSFQVRRELYAKVDKYSKQHGLEKSVVCRKILEEAMEEVELTEEDYEQIKKDIARARGSRNA